MIVVVRHKFLERAPRHSTGRSFGALFQCLRQRRIPAPVGHKGLGEGGHSSGARCFGGGQGTAACVIIIVATAATIAALYERVFFCLHRIQRLTRRAQS